MPKHLKSNMQGGWNETVETRKKSSPKPVDNSWYCGITKGRDIFWLNDKDTSDELRQLVGIRLGIEQIVIDRLLYRFSCDDESKKQILIRYGK